MRKNWPSYACIVCMGAAFWLRVGPAKAQVDWQSYDPHRAAPPLTYVERIGRSPLWVRARVAARNPPLVQYTIVHVIYGDYPDETITLDASGEPARPTPESEIGREVVLELRPMTGLATAMAGVPKYQRMGTSYVPDRAEAEIVPAIADGSAFEVRTSVRILDQIREAEFIVRARLEQIEDGKFKWKVLSFLKGQAKTENLILNDQLFRDRAKTIVADAARKLDAPTTRAPDPARVEAEIKRLISAELTLGCEAILFLDHVEVQPDSIRGHLQYRTYDDASKKLDRFETTITTAP